MCPAPAPLHLERYIGSCLISAGIPHQHHHHHHHHHNNNNINSYQKKELSQTRFRRYPHVAQPNCQQTVSEFCGPGNGVIGNGGPYPRTWSAGLPLISMSPASPRRAAGGIIKDKQQDERSPLSRLAIHTQGAPLIQAGRQQPRLTKQNNNKQKKEKDPKDFSSVASDESSGNSENSLPRIIKPRKRRKKDRKPQPTPGTTPTNQQTVNDNLQETAIVTLKPYTPLCQDFTPQQQQQQQQQQLLQQQQQQQNNFVTNGNTIKLLSEEINTNKTNKIFTEYPLVENASPPCQCRYCDPINLTWDVEQRCYSPYLTPPNSSSSSQDWGLDSRGSSLEVSSEIITSPNGHRDIEIKFFSTSPPASKSTPPARPISVTPPWPN
uniref:Uncharacterized protein n=2 Tax=Rhodnius TaxID=13248 RepID=T1IE71_RHOPR